MHGYQFGQGRRGEVDRVARQLRIGDVALRAFDDQPARHAAAPAVLDRVAELIGRSRFADDAVIDLHAALFQHAADHDRAVGGRAFLIAGDQETDRACMLRMGCSEFFDRHHHRGDRSFHVGGATSVQLAVAVRRHERVRLPLFERSGGDDIGVSGKYDQGLRITSARP